MYDDDIDDLADLANDAYSDQLSEQIEDERGDMLRRKLADPTDLLGRDLLEFVLQLAGMAKDPLTSRPTHEDLLGTWEHAVALEEEWFEDAREELEDAASFNHSR